VSPSGDDSQGSFARFGFGVEEPQSDGLTYEDMGWTLAMRVEQEALKLLVPFRSSDIAAGLGITYQRATAELQKLRWPWSDRALLRDGTRARRWLPQVLDRSLIDDREVVSGWDELHADDQSKTWDEWGDQVE